MNMIQTPETVDGFEILYVQAAVKAGFPSPGADYHEERIDLNKELVQHPLSTFVINSEGDSMVEAFVPPKARLVIDRAIKAQNGDMILAVLNGEFTVKYLKKNDFKCWLIPANRKYPDIEINAEMDFQVWGVVTKIIIDPKDTRCML